MALCQLALFESTQKYSVSKPPRPAKYYKTNCQKDLDFKNLSGTCADQEKYKTNLLQPKRPLGYTLVAFFGFNIYCELYMFIIAVQKGAQKS